MSEVIQTDVVVVGGGSAGVAAAVAAARAGADTLLVERYGFLGGAATAACVGTICGLYLREPGTEVRYGVGKFPREVAERMSERTGTKPVRYKDDLIFLPCKPYAFERVCSDMLNEVKIKTLLQGTVCGLEADDYSIKGVTAMAWNRVVSLKSKAFIDCSGESVVSRFGNARFLEQEDAQAPALVFCVRGLPPLDETMLHVLLVKDIKAGIELEKLPALAARLSIVPGSLSGDQVMLKLAYPSSTAIEVSKIEQECRSVVESLVNYLKTNIKEFFSLEIVFVAPQLGVRSGPRALGQEILTEEQVLSCYNPGDGVAFGCWPIEYWGLDRKPEMLYFQAGGRYSIGAKCLMSATFDNLFFAGRSISGTEKALASARVIGTTLGTGAAAGMLAAAKLQNAELSETVKEIRKQELEILD